MINSPLIKYSGSKRSQSEAIVNIMPKEIDTYYEPFCGGCSVFYRLINSDVKVKKYIISDINKDVIELLNVVKNDSKRELIKNYEDNWNKISSYKDIKERQEFYNSVRDRFNKSHNPYDFMFLTRTAFNGLIRYNSKGDFNASYHWTRLGMQPEKLEKIINDWHDIIKFNDVEFRYCEYNDIIPDNENDFMYLDPPYANSPGLYFGYIDYNKLFEYLKNIKCKYALSFDGYSGKSNNTFDVPKEIYEKHIYIESGTSSFKKITGISNKDVVKDSLYLNF